MCRCIIYYGQLLFHSRLHNRSTSLLCTLFFPFLLIFFPLGEKRKQLFYWIVNTMKSLCLFILSSLNCHLLVDIVHLASYCNKRSTKTLLVKTQALIFCIKSLALIGETWIIYKVTIEKKKRKEEEKKLEQENHRLKT